MGWFGLGLGSGWVTLYRPACSIISAIWRCGQCEVDVTVETFVIVILVHEARNKVRREGNENSLQHTHMQVRIQPQ